MVKNQGEIILYQAEDGNARIKVKLQDETVWLTQKQMGELFDLDSILNFYLLLISLLCYIHH